MVLSNQIIWKITCNRINQKRSAMVQILLLTEEHIPIYHLQNKILRYNETLACNLRADNLFSYSTPS